MRIVVSLGGNAIAHRGAERDADTQRWVLADLGPRLRELAATHQVLITYGAGAQLGSLLADAQPRNSPPPVSLDDAAAQIQGLLGNLLVRELQREGGKPAVALLSQVVVDATDPAFRTPSKFIGPIYSEAEAARAAGVYGYQMAKDEAWWRRVVPSPRPVEIVEIAAIADLLADERTVVCCGNGGIAVTRDDDGRLHPVPAVVDKDLTAALLARRMRADALLLLTDIDAVYTDYDTAEGHRLSRATPNQLLAMTFERGSMGVKVQAACDFVERTGRIAAIGAARDAVTVLEQRSGTTVHPDVEAGVA